MRIEDEKKPAFFLPNLSEYFPAIIDPVKIPTNMDDMISSLYSLLICHSIDIFASIAERAAASAPSCIKSRNIERKALN